MTPALTPGDRVQQSGIYKVVHAGKHAETHYVTAIVGETLPSCLQCSDQVRFYLAISAGLITAHPYFYRSAR